MRSSIAVSVVIYENGVKDPRLLNAGLLFFKFMYISVIVRDGPCLLAWHGYGSTGVRSGTNWFVHT